MVIVHDWSCFRFFSGDYDPQWEGSDVTTHIILMYWSTKRWKAMTCWHRSIVRKGDVSWGFQRWHTVKSLGCWCVPNIEKNRATVPPKKYLLSFRIDFDLIQVMIVFITFHINHINITLDTVSYISYIYHAKKEGKNRSAQGLHTLAGLGQCEGSQPNKSAVLELWRDVKTVKRTSTVKLVYLRYKSYTLKPSDPESEVFCTQIFLYNLDRILHFWWIDRVWVFSGISGNEAKLCKMFQSFDQVRSEMEKMKKVHLCVWQS